MLYLDYQNINLVLEDMFSLVKSINSALKPLEIEAIDSRLDKNNNKFNGMSSDRSDVNEDAKSDFSADEHIILSVKSIILFLEDYLEAKLSSKAPKSEFSEGDNDIAPWFKQNHSNDIVGSSVNSKKAVTAYSHAAEISHKSNKFRQQGKTDIQLQFVYSLINNLRVIHNNGIEHLKIDCRKTFIYGVADAVKKVRLKDI